MSNLRDWYLGALGVTQYVSRDQPTPEELPLAENSSDEEPAIREDSSPKTAPLRAVMKEPAQAPSVSESPAPVAVEEDASPFRLAFWQPTGETVVLSALQPGDRPTADQQQMLANLLAAINQLSGDLPRPEWIDWPLAKQPSIRMIDAREFVQTFLDVKYKLQSFEVVLAMGCGHLLADCDNTVGQTRELRCGARAILTYSLQDMEQDPSLKRDTWNAIKHLAE